jgi:hypothetical protein
MSANNALYRVIKRVKGRIIPTTINSTSNRTISKDEALYGVVVSNAGASGEVVITPPAAVPGMRLTLCVAAAQNLKLDLPTGNTIRGLATSGQTFSADAVGETLQLVCVVPNVWESVGAADGTWTAA